jgi:hypothetical protein
MSIVVDTPTPTESQPTDNTAVELQTEQPVQAEQTEYVEQSEPSSVEIPEKYQGKDVEDIIKMHQNAEKAYGRRGQEIGEQRNLIESLIAANNTLKSPKKESNASEVSEITEDAFYENPTEAVKKTVKNAIEKHPEILKAKQANVQRYKEKATSEMRSSFPEFQETIGNAEFQQWVLDSPIRQQLFKKADRQYNVQAASELLGTWQSLNGATQAKTSTSNRANNRAKRRDEDLKATATENRNSGSSVGGKKMYRRSDLINLQVTDPQRYASLADEIQVAYAEGRVK